MMVFPEIFEDSSPTDGWSIDEGKNVNSLLGDGGMVGKVACFEEGVTWGHDFEGSVLASDPVLVIFASWLLWGEKVSSIMPVLHDASARDLKAMELGHHGNRFLTSWVIVNPFPFSLLILGISQNNKVWLTQEYGWRGREGPEPGCTVSDSGLCRMSTSPGEGVLGRMEAT